VTTTHPASDLAKTGARYRASYLVQQAGYTLGIAAAEGEALAGLLPPNYLDQVAQSRNDVDQARQDKANLEAESKHATSAQNNQLRAAKVWIRKAVKRAQRAQRQGSKVADELTEIGRSNTVPAVLEQMSKKLALLSSHAADLNSVGPATQPLLDEGHQLYDALQQADAAQEQTRAAHLPASVTAFYARKGELYLGLKVINDAGHELHAGDPQAAAKYNLSILHRHPGQAAAPVEAQAPVAAPSPETA
jgi:hypothetical protein